MSCFFFFNDTATTEIYTLSLHDALPISSSAKKATPCAVTSFTNRAPAPRSPAISSPNTDQRCRSEEHTSELQSQSNLVCRLLLEKKKCYPSRLSSPSSARSSSPTRLGT